MSLENLGKRIREVRLLHNITQEQLAEKADISVNFMSLIENGRNMSVETLVKIADTLGVTADYLLRDTLDFNEDIVSLQIAQSISSLSNEEKLFFLNIIKQYKDIPK